MNTLEYTFKLTNNVSFVAAIPSLILLFLEAVARSCSVKTCSQIFRKIERKTAVSKLVSLPE